MEGCVRESRWSTISLVFRRSGLMTRCLYAQEPMRKVVEMYILVLLRPVYDQHSSRRSGGADKPLSSSPQISRAALEMAWLR